MGVEGRPFSAGIRSIRVVCSRNSCQAAAGILLGIFLTGWVSSFWVGHSSAIPWLITPTGATAVILFGSPASSQARYRTVLVANVACAMIGVSVALTIGSDFIAAAAATSAAFLFMAVLRCVHPPAAGVALTAIFGGPAIAGQGYGYAVFPVALNSALLIATAFLFQTALPARKG